MFLHEDAELCRFNPCENERCQYKHTNNDTIETVDSEESDSQQDEEEHPVHSNKCHLCMQQLESKDDLYNHMESDHADFYASIMEAASAMKSGVSEAQGLAGLAIVNNKNFIVWLFSQCDTQININ